MRIRLFTVFAAGLAVHTSTARAQSGPQNLDFERGRVGNTPPGWFVPTSGFAGTISADSPKQGKNCVHLRAGGKGEKAPFGNIMQSFDARAYRGRLVRLRAAIRTEGPVSTGRAQMWLRVDRPGRLTGRRMGFFDNMLDRPIREGEWRYYEILGDVADDAERVNIGLMIIGDAQAWFDDVTFEVIGKAEQRKTEPPRPLQGRALANLEAFTRLLGYIRYFHPSDEAAEADWEEFAITGVRLVESASSSAELANTLENLFRPIAPTIRVFETGRAPPIPAGSIPPADAEGLKITSWKHRGLGSQGTTFLYTSQRISRAPLDAKTADDMPDPAEPLVTDLGGGVSCLVPLALYADRDGTIPKGTPKVKRPSGTTAQRYTAEDRCTRLADVALCWNVMQHFYPYFDVVDADWSAALAEALRAAATDKDERAFLDTLQRLIAGLHDGHGNVWHSNATAQFTLPLLWGWVEGKLVVTHVHDGPGDHADAGGLKPGDVVLEIDGRPARQALTEIEQLVSAATPQFRRYRGLQRLASGPQGEEVTIVIEDTSGRRRNATLRRTITIGEVSEPRPPVVHEIEAGILYVDLNRITDQEFTDALPKLEQAKGIVFDFRGYPNNIRPYTLFAHIIDHPVDSPQWHIPVFHRPDRQNVEFQRGGEWHLSPSEPYLKAKKAFIIDGRCISYAESCLGIIEHYQLGELVGGPTAGTNGNVNPFTLPGGYRVVWTGMKVLKQDGSQHHGVGIQPTVPVSGTIKGVAAGRDELLEKAIEVVSAP